MLKKTQTLNLKPYKEVGASALLRLSLDCPPKLQVDIPLLDPEPYMLITLRRYEKTNIYIYIYISNPYVNRYHSLQPVSIEV